MLNSSSLNSNIMSYLIEDDSTNYSTFLYPFPYSPMIYEFDNFGDFTAFHDELASIQQSLLANNNNNNNDNDNNNYNSSMDYNAENPSMVGGDNNKAEEYWKKRGDHHEEVEVNGIVEDNGERLRSDRGVLMKKKKRTSNKDRHSKIRTAQGLRDRRMRLSNQVAGPFFNLQDMLGYDKASTAVEWLMIQAKPAIDELLQGKHGRSSPPSGFTTMTRCTTISSNSDDCDVQSTTNEEREGINITSPSSGKPVTKKEPKQKERRRRTTKEERKVARERAKKRTLQRMMQTTGTNNPFTIPCHLPAAKL